MQTWTFTLNYRYHSSDGDHITVDLSSPCYTNVSNYSRKPTINNLDGHRLATTCTQVSAR